MNPVTIPEVRRAEDGEFYTEQEFVDYFGGRDEWLVAATSPNKQDAKPTPVPSFGPAPVPKPSIFLGETSSNESEDTSEEVVKSIVNKESQYKAETLAFWTAPSLESAIARRTAVRANAPELLRRELDACDEKNRIIFWKATDY